MLNESPILDAAAELVVGLRWIGMPSCRVVSTPVQPSGCSRLSGRPATRSAMTSRLVTARSRGGTFRRCGFCSHITITGLTLNRCGRSLLAPFLSSQSDFVGADLGAASHNTGVTLARVIKGEQRPLRRCAVSAQWAPGAGKTLQRCARGRAAAAASNAVVALRVTKGSNPLPSAMSGRALVSVAGRPHGRGPPRGRAGPLRFRTDSPG